MAVLLTAVSLDASIVSAEEMREADAKSSQKDSGERKKLTYILDHNYLRNCD